MKVLVFAHRLELGGTQTNAIDLAVGLRDRHGFQVVFHATPGPMQDVLRAKGLELVPAPDARLHPSLARVRVLRELVRREKPDVIHAWDWWQGIEAYGAVHVTMRVPLIISDMMMTLTHLLPQQVPTTFGVLAIQQQASDQGWTRSSYLPPPVDLTANDPDIMDQRECRLAMGFSATDIALVSVSRLSHTLKADSLARTIETVRRLGRKLPLRLSIVGDGSARAELQHLATRTNRELQRKAVTLHGAMTDPRRAYAAADIVMGMGGSALRGMAFGKPVIVTGDNGFARVFDPGTAQWFSVNGIHGIGTGDRGEVMQETVSRLAMQPDLRRSLGAFGQDYVRRHHDIDQATDQLAGLCHAACSEFTPPSIQDAARSAVIYLRERRFRTTSRDKVLDTRS
ncbi:MAG: glycosyltransferase family 4 protein [Paracoccus sp. (in: a-proteobacteria)]